jgi:hypothetical protein
MWKIGWLLLLLFLLVPVLATWEQPSVTVGRVDVGHESDNFKRDIRKKDSAKFLCMHHCCCSLLGCGRCLRPSFLHFSVLLQWSRSFSHFSQKIRRTGMYTCVCVRTYYVHNNRPTLNHNKPPPPPNPPKKKLTIL